MSRPEPQPQRWCEISDRPEAKRFEAVSSSLTEAGVANEFVSIEADGPSFEATLLQARSDFDQIRIGGGLKELAPTLSDRMPSMLLSVRAADAFVRTSRDSSMRAADPGLSASEQKPVEWWPRNFLVDAVAFAVAGHSASLDLSGAVFILGANADTRAVVAALVRIGFNRFNISDPDEEKGLKLVEQLRGAYFKVQFQFTNRYLITQLPGVHSFAVNTIFPGEDDGALTEVFYFNFLKTNGIWLDLPLAPEKGALEAEAKSVGAFVLSGSFVNACAERLWAQTAFGVELDTEALAQAFDR